MALCSSCQNILPQSAERCPICGATPGISPDDFLASLDMSPELFSDHDQLANRAPGEGAFDSSGAPSVAPNGRAFTPPPLPSDASPTPEAAGPGRFPQRRGSSDAVARGIEPFIEPIGDREEIVRTVRAISNRLDADIRIGRRSGHQFFVALAPIAAAFALVFGTYSAYEFADLERPDRTEEISGTDQPGTLAFGAEQSRAAQSQAETVSSQVNEVVSISCGLPLTANAIALSPTRLVTNAAAVANDDHPVIRFANNSSRVGTVIGLDRRGDLAVIEIDAVDGVGTIDWGVADRVIDEPDVVVVERFGAAINGTPATVDQIDGVRGLIKSFSFSRASFRPGSAVLNSDGFIIGMVDDTGRSAIGGAELSAAFSRVVARPSTPATACDVTEAEDVTATEGADTAPVGN